MPNQITIRHLMVATVVCGLIIMLCMLQYQLVTLSAQHNSLKSLVSWQQPQVRITYPTASIHQAVIGSEVRVTCDVIITESFAGDRPPRVRIQLIDPMSGEVETESFAAASIGQGSLELARYGASISLKTRSDLRPGAYLMTVTLLGAADAEVASATCVVKYSQ